MAFLVLPGGASRSRTGLHGFAGRCITALLSRQKRTVRCSAHTALLARTTIGQILCGGLAACQTKGEALLPRNSGAGDESRTRDLNLGKVALYQLSYSRIFTAELPFTTLAPRFAVLLCDTLPLKFGAGDESRTRDLNLGKVALYQLSYSRISTASPLIYRLTSAISTASASFAACRAAEK
ncbi:hypothetical protein PSAC2689_30081 [Paraburkholderia sacchari]